MKEIETSSRRQSRIRRTRVAISRLSQIFPEAKISLSFKSNWELLVAVQLSAQCTDKKVNEITPALFAKYKTLDDYVKADPRKFEQIIFQSGFYRNKTKNILAAAKMVQGKFNGKIPRTMKDMLEIPGVARKTANVVLGNSYGVAEGIAVDTHVKRMVRVLGLSDETEPNNIERDLMEALPRDEWLRASHLLIEYGRKYCPARKHNENTCPLGHYSWSS